MRTAPLTKPVVIAHRGACGYLPEHTFAAKALAYAMGADYLEQDVVATKDDELVVLHDIHLDRVTNVAHRFPDRHREDGRFYVRDFTMAEIRTLKVHERTNADGSAVYPNRFASQNEDFRVHTFAEELQFAARLQKAVGRPIGVYPEIKRPAWHREEGVDIAPAFLEILTNNGYTSRDDPVFVQCFDDQELLRIRGELSSELKLIQLLGENSWGEAETDYEKLCTASGIRTLAETVDGIGPWLEQLIEDPQIVACAHREGLDVHPYTFRRDDMPAGYESFDELLRFAFEDLRIDGLFTDFPDLAKNAIDA